jgi:hypothetical protein
LTNPDNTNIINFDLWKQAAGGRHQIGTLAGFKSEQVAGFLLECMAGFVGIRNLDLRGVPQNRLFRIAVSNDRLDCG